MDRNMARPTFCLICAFFLCLVFTSVAMAGEVEDLIAQLEHPIWTTRRDAALRLGELPLQAPLTVKYLSTALEDRVGPVRYAAATALGQIGPWAAQTAVPALIEALFDEDPEMRWHAAAAVGQIGPLAVEAVPALAETLLDNYTGIREAAAWALGMIGPEAREAIPALSETMLTADENVQQMAKAAIIEIGGVKAVPMLPPTEGETGWAEAAGTIRVAMETTKGNIELALRGDLMPLTVANFVKLAEASFYDGLSFHRVEDWVAQGGDPEGDGTGGPGYSIVLETHPELKNVRGAIAMARASHPDSAGSQFYILKTDAAWLDGDYAVFGQVTAGMDVVDSLSVGDIIKTVTVNQ